MSEQNKFYCQGGCGSWVPLKRRNSDGEEETVSAWVCSRCAASEMASPSDKNCRKCSKVLTQGEKKICHHRNSNNPDFICNPCYYNKEKPTGLPPSESEEYTRLTRLMLDSKTLTELESNWQTVKNSPLYDSNKKSWKKSQDDNKTGLDKTYNSCKSGFCTSCLNDTEHHQLNCSMKCKKCNYSIVKEGSFKCLNLDCDNYWGKYDDLKDKKVDDIDNNREREREREREQNCQTEIWDSAIRANC